MSQSNNFDLFGALPIYYQDDQHRTSILVSEYDGGVSQGDLYYDQYEYAADPYAQPNFNHHGPVPFEEPLASPFEPTNNLPSIEVQNVETPAQHQTSVSRLPITTINTNVQYYPDQQSPSFMLTSASISPNSLTPSESLFPPQSGTPALLWSPQSSTRTESPSTPHLPRNISSVLRIAESFPSAGRGPFIPQKPYRPHTLSDRKRYVEDVELEEPIWFFMHYPEECGIPLTDALTGKYMRLEGRDDHMFIQRGPSVSIRLRWPGYESWSRQIPTKDFRSPPGPITRAKLAKNIARTVERFIKDKQRHPVNPEDSRWRVGTGGIRIENLLLVGLEHVSKGSWQAHLRLAHPTAYAN